MKNLRTAAVLIIGIGVLAFRVAGVLTDRGRGQASSSSIPGAGANGYSAVVVPSIKPEKVGQPAPATWVRLRPHTPTTPGWWLPTLSWA